MTLGSLFDGSGGFPLGAILCGITPVRAAEVEPYPIKVTKARVPFMKHLGNVTEIDGAKIEPVDIITFGSPCQDLSIGWKFLFHTVPGYINYINNESLDTYGKWVKFLKEYTDNDYALSDYNVKIYHHSGNLNEIYRKYMLEKFGTAYALDFLLNYTLANWD